MNLDNAAHAHVSCKKWHFIYVRNSSRDQIIGFLIFFFCGSFRALLKIPVEDLLSVTHLCPNQCGVIIEPPTQTTVDRSSFSVPGIVLLVIKSLPPIGRQCYGWLLAPLSP